MSRFFSSKYSKLTPYTPGEQPRDIKYIKLNTNESPFPPSPKAQEMAKAAAENLQLYSDPECRDLTDAAAPYFGIEKDEIIFTNGSDDVLNFAFMAFCDKDHPAVFPDITYGFYKVFAALNAVPYREIPLKEDFTIDPSDYKNTGSTIFIANPNAPTGISLTLSVIEDIVSTNQDNIVIIDEAYVDFGGESAIPLIKKYDNLLVTGTFSKSRSMAGARLGFGIGCSDIIRDLNTIRFSTNPYNINRMTMAAGIGSIMDHDYFTKNCNTVIENREWTKESLINSGFEVLPSKANFVFAINPDIPGKELYQSLRDKGILVRHFDTPRLTDYLRITIGDMEEMESLIKAVREILS